MDSRSPYYAAWTQLAGNYSLAFSSGVANGADPSSPWVNAYISQTGVVPSGTKSIQLLATGPFQVFVGGVNIPMYSLGGNSYGGDISAYASQTVEIKIMNTANTVHTPTIVDNIGFSFVSVPEPTSVGLLLSGLTLCFIGARKRLR